MPGLGAIGRLKDRASRSWQDARAKHPWLDHVARGYGHYQNQHGDQLAAAITYFSFLALFPLILLGVSVTGFVLASSHNLQDKLFKQITTQVPGSFGDTLKAAIDTAIHQRAAIGVIGLVGVALTGLGWIDNLRAALDTLWGNDQRRQSFLMRKLSDALVLLGLGLGLVISVGITAGGTAAGHQLLVRTGLDGVTGAGTATALLAILLAIVGNMLIYGWILIRLPDAPVSRRTAFRASLLAAVGFEILKVLGTYYIARIASSPAYSVIGPALGVLVFLNLVSRYSLFCAAWAATAPDAEQAVDPLSQPVAGPPVAPARAGYSPAGVAAALLTAGATLGAAAFAALRARRSQAIARRPPPR
jgi:membrane protein